MNEDLLLDTFGEILCGLVRSDQGIDDNTTKALEIELQKYDWGAKVFWSFTYESKHNRSVKEAYERALDTFAENGASDKYYLFFEIMDKVAQRYAVTDYQKRMPDKFKVELMNRLKSSAEGSAQNDDDLED